MRTSATCCFPLLLAALSFGCESAETRRAAEEPPREEPLSSTNPFGLEDLILPWRSEGPHEDPWLVLEVHRDGRVFVDGRCEFVHESGTDEELEALLARCRAAALADGRCHLEAKESQDGVVEVVDDPILIRAQKGTEWAAVDRIMKRCAQPSLRIWRIQLAMLERDR